MRVLWIQNGCVYVSLDASEQSVIKMQFHTWHVLYEMETRQSPLLT